MAYYHLKSVLPADFVSDLRSRAEKLFEQVHDEYFAQIPLDDFRVLCQKESLISRILTFRFMSNAFVESLRKWVTPKLHEIMGRDDEQFVLCPYFYLRFCWPQIYLSAKHEAAYLYTEPHYDTALGVEGYSMWIPLEKADAETGGLCFFSDEQLYQRIPRGTRNVYSISRYLDDASQIDPYLKDKEIQPDIEAGELFVFDTHTLHGATKPKTRRRLSLNMRLILESFLAKGTPEVQALCRTVDQQLDICNAMNLALLGDHLGAKASLAKVPSSQRSLDLFARAKAAAEHAGSQQLGVGRKLGWADEYRWHLPELS
jgi:hypothetical protein